jgi:hypothetical protein
MCLLDFNKTWNSLRIFIKALDLKFQGNPSSWNRADTDRQTDRRTDMTRVTGALVATTRKHQKTHITQINNPHLWP